MSGVKHTGWKADCGFHRHDPKMTCSVRITSGTVQVKTEDEARLIAAAPDLLEALVEVLEALDVSRNGGEYPSFEAWEAKARDAITRATGDRPEKGGAL